LLKKTFAFIVLILILIQFIRIDKTNPKVDEELTLKAPSNAMTILKNACYDCHSNETKWPYYADIAPISFFVASHVKKGRKAINFSEWRNIDTKIKKQRLKRAVMTVNNGRMALPTYVYAHDEALLSSEQKKVLTDWFKNELELIENSEVSQ